MGISGLRVKLFVLKPMMSIFFLTCFLLGRVLQLWLQCPLITFLNLLLRCGNGMSLYLHSGGSLHFLVVLDHTPSGFHSYSSLFIPLLFWRASSAISWENSFIFNSFNVWRCHFFLLSPVIFKLVVPPPHFFPLNRDVLKSQIYFSFSKNIIIFLFSFSIFFGSDFQGRKMAETSFSKRYLTSVYILLYHFNS